MLLVILLTAAALAATSVTDGDTVTIDGTKIRIANIDAPELGRAQCDAEKRLAKVAKARVTELLASGKIVVHPGDPASGRLKDRHGRTLATITVDGRDLGEILMFEELARPWKGKRQPWCLTSE